jgi:hypothetical protein
MLGSLHLNPRRRCALTLQAIVVLFFLFYVVTLLLADMAGSVAVSVWIITDDDADGLPDSWELRYFPDLTIVSDTSDYDLDGFIDAHECAAGTDPKDPSSLLKLMTLALLPDGTVRVTWQSSSESHPAPRSYDIFFADTVAALAAGGIPLELNVPTAGSHTTVDDASVVGSRRFYRIKLRR